MDAQPDLGQHLVQRGFLTPEQLEDALEEARTLGRSLAYVLESRGVVAGAPLLAALGDFYGRPTVDLDAAPVEESLLELVPADIARRARAAPVSRSDRVLVVAVADPTDEQALDELRFVTRMEIEPRVATPMAVERFLERHYADDRAFYSAMMLDELEEVAAAAPPSRPVPRMKEPHRVKAAPPMAEEVRVGAPAPTSGAPEAPAPAYRARVHFATNRNHRGAPGLLRRALLRVGIGDESRFGTSRVAMRYGVAEVGIPQRHRRGEIERPTLWRLELREDPSLHVTVQSLSFREEKPWVEEIARVMREDAAEILLYVHGYRVGFEEALRRTGQLAFDLDFPGAAVCFSWPSMGKVLRYDADKVRAEQSAPDLAALLRRLMEETGVRRFHVVAHSMGNLVLERALALVPERAGPPAFNNVVLSSPDLDATVFREQIAPRITRQAGRVTMYASKDDFALKFSGLLQAASRAGRMSPTDSVVDGVDVIDVSDIAAGLLEHSHLHESSDVLMDLFLLYRHDAGPETRNLRRMGPTDGPVYWYMPRQ